MSRDVKGQYIDIDGQKIYYYTLDSESDTTPMVFIHGHRSDALRFKGIMLAVAQYAPVIAPDLPGCGKSPAYTNDWHSMENYARTLESFVIKKDLQNIVLSGGSMGGIIALLLYPRISDRVSKVILLGTPVHYKHFSRDLQKFIRMKNVFYWARKSKVIPWIFQRIINNNTIMNLLYKRFSSEDEKDPSIIDFEINQWRAMDITVWMETIVDIMNTALTEREDIYIDVPTLIFESKQNQYYDIDKTLSYLTSIAPNSQIQYITWDKHVPRGELSPKVLDEYKKVLVEFLEK